MKEFTFKDLNTISGSSERFRQALGFSFITGSSGFLEGSLEPQSNKIASFETDDNESAKKQAFTGSIMPNIRLSIRIVGDDASANEQTFSAGNYFHLAGTNRFRQPSNRSRLTPSPFGSDGSFNGLPLSVQGKTQIITNCYSVDTLGEVYDKPNQWYSACHDAQADDGVIPATQIPTGGLVPFIAMGNRANAGNQCKLTVDSFTVVQERI